jgi:glyoxylase-like metal-dependent hydrolase (beta-lactamase superfamily II)
MRKFVVAALGGLAMAAAQPLAQQPADPVKTASDTIGAGALKTLRFTAFGATYSIGQSPAPGEPWPRVTVTSYEVLLDYDTPAQQIDMTRQQGPIPPRGGGQPFVGDQRQQQFVSGDVAWNVPFAAPPEGAPGGRGRAVPAPQTPQAAPAAVTERVQQIWTTPHGFLKAAVANKAAAKAGPGGTEIVFTANGRRYAATINAANQVERVRTWVDNPVLGDMLVETVYSSYQKFDGGVMFPMRIVQRTGGHPSLDLWISSVTPNAMGTIDVPEAVKTAPRPVPRVDVQEIADGVYWLTGGSHHSVAIAMRDHVVVVEGPLDEERAAAVIARVKELIPDRPIRFVVNTHHHFDHSGGLRSFATEGATIVTHQSNRAFYDTAWAAPRTTTPDARPAKKAALFRTVADRAVLTDGARVIEVHRLVNNPHDDGFFVVYLPVEKILVEADAYTPGPTAGAAPVSSGTAPTVNPATLNLYQNLRRLKLDVARIAPLHGQRLASFDDLARAAGRSGTD